MINRRNIILNAQKAEFPKSFIDELEEFLDFVDANGDAHENLENYYKLLFESGEDFFPIVKVRDIPVCQKCEEKFPGFFRSVIFIAAANHFEKYIKENGLENCKYDLVDTYYKNLRRFGEMNFVRDNTYALIRHGYFLYGYAKPFILHIGRLSYELREYDASVYNIYESTDGETRVFITKDDRIPEGYKKVIEHGEPYVTIHIPGTGKLTRESVLDSIEAATPILKKVFKKYSPKHFLCTSWLISPQLKTFLKETSNIRVFGSFFDAALGNEAENALYEHIFKVPVCPVGELKAENSFQKSILEIYEKGDRLCNGIGILKKEFNKL